MFKRENGFTLIELLVVIAILGVIAAVVALNIGGFIDRGRVEAANTELHQVETAIVAYVADVDVSVNNVTGTIGPESNYPVSEPSSGGVLFYVGGGLQADYEVVSGVVVNATPVEDSRWGNLHFCGDIWQVEPCD
jgi:prepilin-type N-terminal cleavage/methylation domain-containing protein